MLMVLSALVTLAAAPLSVAEQGVVDSYLYSSSQKAAEREKAIVTLFESRPALATATYDGEPILVHAIRFVGVAGDLGERGKKLAELVVAQGAPVDVVDDDGDPLLVAQARFARVEEMKFLLDHGADPDLTDRDGRSALHWVALLLENREKKTERRVAKNLAAAALLLDKKATLELRDRWGKTPLATTAFLGNLAMTAALLARGANLHALDKDGYSILGLCKLRVEDTPKKPSFATDDERAATLEVIRFLEKKGAKDVQPRDTE